MASKISVASLSRRIYQVAGSLTKQLSKFDLEVSNAVRTRGQEMIIDKMTKERFPISTLDFRQIPRIQKLINKVAETQQTLNELIEEKHRLQKKDKKTVYEPIDYTEHFHYPFSRKKRNA